MRRAIIIGLVFTALTALNYGGALGQMMGHDMTMGGGRGMQMGQGGMMAQPAPGGQSAQRSMEGSALSRGDRQGAVNLQVTYLERKGEVLSFGVRMDTHSVDLDQYKIEKISLLRDDKGNQLEALRWEGDMGGGHHRSGVLVFPARFSDGKEVMGPNAKYVEVVVKGVAGVAERAFKWDLPLAR